MTDAPEPSPPSLPEPVDAPPKRRLLPPVTIALAVIVVAAGLSSAWWLPRVKALIAHPAPVAAPAPEAASPPPETPATADTSLTERLDRLEATVQSLRDAGPATSEIASLRADMATLGRRIDTAQPAADPGQLASLADELKATQARLARLEAAAGERRSEAHAEIVLALAAGEIASALAESGPFEAPVALARSAAGTDENIRGDLDTLARHARTGLPSRAALAEALALLPARLGDPIPAADAGFWDRMRARVTGLVTIRRVDEDATHPAGPPGPDRIIADAHAQLVAGDLAGAVATIEGLDGDAARQAASWLDQAKARLEAETAARSLAAQAAKRLGGADAP